MVLDASVALAWCFEDEITDRLEPLLRRVMTEGALVPTGWALEIAQGLAVAERRRRIPSDGIAVLVERMRSLGVTVDRRAPDIAWDVILELARRLAVSAYDASYVELAQRRGLPLATLDRRLAAAARSSGLIVLPG